MTGQELLDRVKDQGKAVDSAKAVYQSLFQRLTSGTSRLRETVVKGSSADDKLVSLRAAGERVEALQAEYDALVILAQKCIDGLADERYQRDLRYRYICGYTAKKTAQAMHYGFSWEREIHRRAVEAFDNIYADFGKTGA